MAHDHHHHHHHVDEGRRTLPLAVLLTFAFACVELVVGSWSGSLSLASDAAHMFSDAAALAVAAFAEWLARRPASSRHSYGLARAEVVAAFLNGLVMLVVVVAICVEAVLRLLKPSEVSGLAAMSVAFVGLLVNFIVMWILGSGHTSLNRRAATLHVIGDLLGSVAALTAGAVVYFTGWVTIDPLLSIVISLLILYSTIQLLRSALHVLMEGVPAGLQLEEVGRALAQVSGVNKVHDLHVWNISSGANSLSAHIEIESLVLWPAILEQSKQVLRQRFHLRHVTLQPEVKNGLNPGYQAHIRIVPRP
jgi:cobalt-zinc-cadmium efflux system protein